MALQIELLPAFGDNYIFLLHDQDSGKTAVVDPGDAQVVIDALESRGWQLDTILVTHHHPDHIGGNSTLIKKYACQVVGFAGDRERVTGITQTVSEGDSFPLGSSMAQVIEVPGHTTGHIAYWFQADQALFCGDTLFAMGCGRLFEGTAQQMWRSLEKLANLPGETRVYCAHEYTQANGQFALKVEPNNRALQQRMKIVGESRQNNQPTIPSTIALELETNPFLRPQSPEIRDHLKMGESENWQVFAQVRQLKDRS